MKNAITFVRFFRKKEADQLENRLKAYADATGYDVVWHERVFYLSPKSSVDEIIIKTLNNQHYQGVKVDAILVVRYDHIHRKFTQTAKLIKTISHYGVRIVSVEETVDENDPLFTEIYFPNQL
jgi:DNA invertase Pin-like site-specific DNA recombinase